MYYFNVGSCITAMNTKNFKLAIKLIFIMGLFFRQAAADDYQRIVKVCNYDSDCTQNAYCKEQRYCQCKEGFIVYVTGTNSFSCLKVASILDDACEADIQCMKPFGSHAECVTDAGGFGMCRCMPNAHFKDNRCYEISKIGGKCSVNNDCFLASGKTAYCIKSVCECASNDHPNENGTDCIRTARLDEPCNNDQECVTENSRCGEVCRCRINYIQSRQKDKCLKAADKMGDPCVEDEQCTMFLAQATCGAEGRCSCSPGYHHIWPNSKCFRDIGLGEMCEETAECAVPSAVCSAGTCRCGPAFSPSEDNSRCIGKNGQQMNEYCLNVLLSSIIIMRIFKYFTCPT